jgi:hypothetical protein
MTDNWEDWEADDFTIPVLNIKQSKELEERKLVEEADNKLTNDLFSDEKDHLHDKDQLDLGKKTGNKSLQVSRDEKKAPPKNFVSKKAENEQKQKEISRKNKEDKKRKEKAAELYGEAEDDDKYAEYEDMFY